VYEAGFCGFWAHRKLREQGVYNIVTNAADVPTKSRERDKKKDRVDSRKLARELQNGSLDAIYVPSVPSQDLRSLCRLRRKLMGHSTRLKNRIKQHLHFRGIGIASGTSHWSASFIAQLEALCPEGKDPGADTLRTIVDELKDQRKRITETTKRLRHYAAPIKEVQLLRTVPGIGFLSAVTLYTELIDMSRFNSLDTLSAYVGLVPGSRDSGDKHRDAGITSIGNRHLRYVLIEAAWTAVRIDAEMLRLFSGYCRKQKKNKAIVKIAKKLLGRIRHIWIHQEAYCPPEPTI
jgi:transposase